MRRLIQGEEKIMVAKKSSKHATSIYILLGRRIYKAFSRRFSLHLDKAEDLTIDKNLRAGVDLHGATLWILMFAILIASVGLNVNSTAVIIGAMLISPLMGPIMGIGYGVGIYDFRLIKRSLTNLGIATAISLLTSTIYFAVSPLSEAQPELLARTTPTIWDVLIALFGGLAGVVGATRKEKSNVIPGVAIATALMPPLCTAGFGLAHGDWKFFFGAIYLFSINCVFIAVSTAVVISLLKLPNRNFVDKQTERHVKRILLFVVAMTALPSCYLAYQLVEDEVFKHKAQIFVRHEFQFKNTQIVNLTIMPRARRIAVTLVGDTLDAVQLESLNAKLNLSGLAGASMTVHQNADNKVDIASIKEGILSDLYRNSVQLLNQRDKKIQELQAQLALKAESLAVSADILRELQAQYPQIERLMVGRGQVMSAVMTDKEPRQTYLLFISLKEPLAKSERDRLLRWFRARSRDEYAEVVVEVPCKAKRN